MDHEDDGDTKCDSCALNGFRWLGKGLEGA